MARYRTVINIGITLGTVPAGIALAGGDAFGALLAANAVSYLAGGGDRRDAAAHRAARARAGPGSLVPSAPTAALIGVDGLMSMWVVVLNVGLPLWILQATPAAPALVAVLYAVNTVLAVLFQTRASRLVRSYADAAQAQRAAGVLLAACCACLAGSAVGSRELSTLLLVAAVLCLTARRAAEGVGGLADHLHARPTRARRRVLRHLRPRPRRRPDRRPGAGHRGRARAGERGLAAARRGVRGRRRAPRRRWRGRPARATGRRAQAAARAAALHAAARAAPDLGLLAGAEVDRPA